VHALGVGGLDLRIGELQGPAEPRRLAREPDQLSLAEALLDELPSEPRGLHARRAHVGGIEELDLGEHLPARGAPLADRADDGLGGLLALGDEMSHRPDVGVVEVAGRQVPQEVADRPDAQPFQKLGRPVADTRQRLDLQVEARRAIPQRR